MADEGLWTMATAEDDGKALIFRIRQTPPGFATKEAFPHLLTVSWPYAKPTGSGMPTQGEGDRMNELEDVLIPAFESAKAAFLAIVTTGNGSREWLCHARDPGVVMTLANETLGRLKPFPVQFSFHDDPGWDIYQSFLETGE